MDPETQISQLSLRQLLRLMVDRGGSDLHITEGSSPQLRIDGLLNPVRTPPLNAQQTKTLCYEVMSEEQRGRFEQNKELDFSFGVKDLARFRANVFLQRGAVTGAFRMIPYQIRSLKSLGLPEVVGELAEKPRGLVLVTGPTGSGKSTTLAAMVDKINREKALHIVTVEDPIEYLHKSKAAIVNQREIGADTQTFAAALKYVLRQDPDVVLLGEMRDLETIQAALTVSETGHLVLATLHTNSAIQSINRMIDVFPPHQQKQVRVQLSFVLEGVVTQMLLPRSDGPGRALACEVMVPNAAIRALIRDEKAHQIYGIMQTGQATSNMQTMNQSLVDLCSRGLVDIELASSRSSEPVEFQSLIRQAMGT